MDIRKATRSYETWLGRHTGLVRADLRVKHARMAESPFVLLRGTFYRWMQVWPEVCEALRDAPVVHAVGDLHIENFGTWRDTEGRLIWGVNDVDEACWLPYTNDLVRLATSALLAIRERHLALSPDEACAAILEGFAGSLARGGEPLVLGERRRWLRRIALNDLRDPVEFWARLTSHRPATATVPHTAFRKLMPATRSRYQVISRVAGVGSLGRPRFVALAEWGGSFIAREAKAYAPSAALWARPGAPPLDGAVLLARARRVPDPFFLITRRWIVRRLAPDCSRIEMAELPRVRDEARLLRAMGWETANIHLGSPRPGRIAKDVERRPRRWLVRAARKMAEAVLEDWWDWKDLTRSTRR